METNSKTIRLQVWQLAPAGSSVTSPKIWWGPKCLILGE